MIIEKRETAGFTDCLQTGKMNHGIDRGILDEDAIQCFFIQKVALDKLRSLPRDLLDPVEDAKFAVDEIVHDDNLFPRVQKFHHCVRADKAGTAGYKNCHIFVPSFPKSSL